MCWVVRVWFISVILLPSVAEQMTARLVNGTSEAGRLEIYFRGEWGTVCGRGFGQREAEVACRILGFKSTGVTALSTELYGSGEGPVLLHSVECEGTESSLEQCKFEHLYPRDCGHEYDIGVVCNITKPMTARLYGGTSTAGRLEISVNGEWTTVCRYYFIQIMADVVCKMLGFNRTGQAAVTFLIFGDGSGFQLSYTNCQGIEPSLEQCELGPLRKRDCQDIGILCDFRNFSVRLTGPRRISTNTGRVEVKFGGGRFSTVCFNDTRTAAVICRQLNLPSNYSALTDGLSYGRKESPLLRITFVCEGSENSLEECPVNNNAWDCNMDDIGVVCSTENPIFIVSEAEMYPFIEGANRALMCVTPRKYQRFTEYTWIETAGGRPDGDLLIFDNLTRDYNGRLVKCHTYYRDVDLNRYYLPASSGFHVLKVYYRPLITITWTDNTGKQQPLSNLSELTPGHNVTLWCEADSNPPPASITWSGRVNSTTGELRIIAAEHVTHSGLYTCTVVTHTVDDDDRLPLTSSYQLTLSLRGRCLVAALMPF